MLGMLSWRSRGEIWLNIIDVHSEKDALAFLDERKALSR